jgi:hypothetical protein
MENAGVEINPDVGTPLFNVLIFADSVDRFL